MFNWSFRKKILFAYLLVLIFFLTLIFPVTDRAIDKLIEKTMDEKASGLIVNISSSKNNQELIQKLKDQRWMIYFRVSIISDENKVLWDSHTKRILGDKFSQEFATEHPEVTQAFKTGKGYHEALSKILNQELSYFAKAFDFQGKRYVLRLAFPLDYVNALTTRIKFGFMIAVITILLLFSLTTWLIIQFYTDPIKKIISAVKPYQEGKTDQVPEIIIREKSQNDEFDQLAKTLNSLSKKITAQINNLTEEKNEKMAILESLVEGVVSIDQKNIITYTNGSFLDLLNLSSSQLSGKPIETIGENSCVELLIQSRQKQKVLKKSLTKNKRYFDLIAAPKQDKTGAILVLQDKTQERGLIEMRKDFIANASHELKTPITIIQGFAETLHDHPDLSKEKIVEITEKITSTSVKMNRLIEELLTLTRIENIPESQKESVAIIPLIENILANATLKHKKVSFDLSIDLPEKKSILAEKNLIELALSNLIENGIKYSSSPALIQVFINQDKSWLKIAIQDMGYGIPKEEIPHIFTRFYRVDKSHSKKIAGFGLGLSIVETIIAKHGGKIRVKSEEDKGSTFTVYLPHELKQKEQNR